MELTKLVEVGTGGHIELTFPELLPGQEVEVRVLTVDSGLRKVPQFGRMKGRITIHDNFDDPIPGFEDYM